MVTRAVGARSGLGDEMEDVYRYFVRVTGRLGGADYGRLIEVDGPRPEDAVVKALGQITEGDNDLWQADEGTIRWERVR